MSLLELFCAVDDFCQAYETHMQQQPLLEDGRRRQRAGKLSLSEVMTLCIHFHQSHYRDFKSYYTEHVRVHLRGEFPGLVSYNRFVELMQRAALPLAVYLQHCFGQCTGISFVDSTALGVCRYQRISQHKVFTGLATRGKTSLGWFFGFKLHIVVSDCGELLACQVTPGHVDDRKPLPHFAKRLFGKLFGDKGYLSQALVQQLHLEHGVHLITFARKNMQGRLLHHADVLLLRKRAIVETIHDQLKNISQIEHSRHRSPISFMVNLLAGLIAYCHQPKKPSLHLHTALALPAA
jgi:hypothetical protein